MSAKSVSWDGGAISVSALLVPRFLWQTASIKVEIDGRPIIETGGVFKFSATNEAKFEHNDSVHDAILKWKSGFLRPLRYTLQIDGEAVSEGNVPIKNWPLSFLPYALLIILSKLIWHH